ncbi:Fungal Zn2-Cys6 binuclear cluster domain-containing protein [Cladophialophora immunda]|nr:Fungal Zn2-Cys6 binuclear cluster domain-containing protein [Cladophialophora immunda]
MPQTSDVSRVSKRLREGSGTCSECRRRKVRCVYSSDSISECTRCRARGIPCVVPKPRGTDDSNEERKTLRERVATLERLVQSLSGEKRPVSRATASIVTGPDEGTARSSEDDPSELTRRAPLVAALEASQLLSTQPITSTSGSDQHVENLNPHADGKDLQFPTPSLARGEVSHVCEQLRAALPPYNELKSCFSGDTKWWDFWHIKTFGTDSSHETLLEFLERVYTMGTPVELGFLVSSYGRHNAAEASQFLPLVDRLVLAGERFASNVEGLLLTVFHAKVYLDVGQPRRAFLCNRHGISLAQIMVVYSPRPRMTLLGVTDLSQNLHRNYSSSPRRSAAWWTLYLGDRFLSVLLGLPYAISDDSFIITYADKTSEVGHATLPFAIRLGMLTGRVIDQVQSRKGPKFSEILDIDDELTSLASTKPIHWWDHQIPANSQSDDMNELRERLICQTQYFLTRIYLHLPYLLKSPTSHLYVNSRLTAVESARDLLRRYLSLRSQFNSQPIFDCQSVDFVGFMGAVILVIGSFCDSGAPPRTVDVELANETMGVLQRVAANKINHLSRECHKTLATLLSLVHVDDSLRSTVPSKISIPYFGTLYVASERHLKSSSLQTSSQQSTLPDYPASLSNSFINVPDAVLNCQSSTIAYEGMYSFDSDLFQTQDEFPQVSCSLDIMPDLDQDWESFFNSDI